MSIVAYLRGTDKKEAQAFYDNVQAYCKRAPYFSDVGEAIMQLSPNAYTAHDVALLASELRGWAENVAAFEDYEMDSFEDNENETTISDEDWEQFKKLLYGPLRLDFDNIWRITYSQADGFIRAVAEQVRLELFASSLKDKTVGVTGDDPYDSADSILLSS